MSDKPTTDDAPQAAKPTSSTNPDCENNNCHEERLQKYGKDQDPIHVEKPVNMEECMGRSMEHLSTVFAASAKRWESIVYPSLFAFILLAAYGFFLIYSLATDVHRVAESMAAITDNMKHVAVNMDKVTKNITIMTQTIDSQSNTVGEMAVNIRGMNSSMSRMHYEIASMNNSVSRPMSFMNSFMPW